MFRLWAVLAAALLAAPNLLTLQAATYPWVRPAQWLAVIGALIAMGYFGRASRRLRAAFWWGAMASIAATLAGAAILRLPAARAALAANLPGVPAPAVDTMLAIHWQVSAALSALLNGLLFGLAGLYVAWWGRRIRRSPPL
ncbi:MAG: hypothetical protein K6U87_09430 [Firmicutes bacterium]|nr:hypothetical protein [Bacillota bacterium]